MEWYAIITVFSGDKPSDTRFTTKENLDRCIEATKKDMKRYCKLCGRVSSTYKSKAYMHDDGYLCADNIRVEV